jgi:hypothetical protein
MFMHLNIDFMTMMSSYLIVKQSCNNLNSCKKKRLIFHKTLLYRHSNFWYVNYGVFVNLILWT